MATQQEKISALQAFVEGLGGDVYETTDADLRIAEVQDRAEADCVQQFCLDAKIESWRGLEEWQVIANVVTDDDFYEITGLTPETHLGLTYAQAMSAEYNSEA